MIQNPSSTLAAVLVGDVVSAEHWRDSDDCTHIKLTYADGKNLWLMPDGSRFRYEIDNLDQPIHARVQ